MTDMLETTLTILLPSFFLACWLFFRMGRAYERHTRPQDDEPDKPDEPDGPWMRHPNLMKRRIRERDTFTCTN